MNIMYVNLWKNIYLYKSIPISEYTKRTFSNHQEVLNDIAAGCNGWHYEGTYIHQLDHGKTIEIKYQNFVDENSGFCNQGVR